MIMLLLSFLKIKLRDSRISYHVWIDSQLLGRRSRHMFMAVRYSGDFKCLFGELLIMLRPPSYDSIIC